MISIDAAGVVCLWPAFQGTGNRSGFGWFSALGQWRLPTDVTAQVPTGGRVQMYPALAPRQGLTLVHFPAQRKRFLWHRGFGQGLLRGSLGGVGGCSGVFRVCF